jgi:hypothetical protein
MSVDVNYGRELKGPWHAIHRVNTMLETKSQPWESLTMDFISEILETTASDYICVVVSEKPLTMVVIYMPLGKNTDSTE